MEDLIHKATDYLNKLYSLGYDAFIVGGAVRDKLRGVGVSDVDVATNCPMDTLSKHFSTYNIGASKDFGILLVLHKGERFETAQFRSDGDYSDGRRPDKVALVKDVWHDLTRRDFTINAMAMDKNGKIIDIVGGQRDVKDKVIRAVGDPMVRFGQEDYLRMMRAARFGAMEGFIVGLGTRLAIRRLSYLINEVSKERIQGELIKAASKSGAEFSRFITLLDRLNLLSKILPEVHAMKYFKQSLIHHPEGPTVLMHTMKAVEMLEDKPWISKLATLFHDIGKPITLDEEKYGYKLSYPRHERTSASLTKQLCDRLKFSRLQTEEMVFAVENHMKFHKLTEMRPSKIARLVSSPYFETLADVCYADEFARGEEFISKGRFWASLRRAREVKKKWETKMTPASARIVDGKRVMKLLNIKPSKEVGEIKRKVEDRVIDGSLDPDDGALVDKLILEAWEEENVLENY